LLLLVSCWLQTGGETKEMERTVACLRKAIFDKEAPLKVAETRLEERTRRVDVELCKDPAMQGSVNVGLLPTRHDIAPLNS